MDVIVTNMYTSIGNTISAYNRAMRLVDSAVPSSSYTLQLCPTLPLASLYSILCICMYWNILDRL